MTDDFGESVQRQIQRLIQLKWHNEEAEVAAKRISWFDDRGGVPSSKQPTPRDGYELLMLEYLGLTEDEVPVVSETETEIMWLSRNPCPTLEACRRLSLDTRDVCRSIYERSTQALLSQLDPHLRFLRSYDEIRPHALHCRETVVRVDFEKMMRVALDEAAISKAEGNKGYGAVVAVGNRIAAQAHDTAVTEGDPSLHAETTAIRRTVKELDDPNLRGAMLFSTCEPCPMCSSLAVWANVTSIVYGASIEETARAGRTRILVDSKTIVAQSPGTVEVIGGVLHDECVRLYEEGRHLQGSYAHVYRPASR